MSTQTRTESQMVQVSVVVETKGYEMTITAEAGWPVAGEMAVAKAVRVIDTYKAKSVKGVTVEEFIEATKRDALRELVTNLNLYKVIS